MARKRRRRRAYRYRDPTRGLMRMTIGSSRAIIGLGVGTTMIKAVKSIK